MNQTSPPRDGLAELAEIFRSQRSGMLVLGEASSEMRVQLESGQIVALGPAAAEAKTTAALPHPDDSVRLRLERVLAEIGMRKAAPPASAGPEPDDAAQAAPTATLRDRLIEKLADESQPVRFEEGPASPADLVAVAVATEPLILETVRLLRTEAGVRRALGDLDQTLVATSALVDERTLTLTEGYLLARIDGIASMRHVLELVPLDPVEVERTLLGLLLTGRIETRPAPRPLPVEERLPITEKLEALQREAEPFPELVAASTEIVAEAVADTEETATPPLAEAASAAQPEAVPEPEPPPAVDVRPPGPAPSAVPSAAEVPPMDESTVARRREIVEVFQSLPLKQNHFGVLGVEPGCTDDEVKRAYITLAKRYHPDANRDKRLHDLHDMLEAIMIRVGEAWEVLGEAKSRASYETRAGIVRRGRSSQADGTGTGDATGSLSQAETGGYVPPEEILFRARRLLTQARYWDAIQILESALPAMEPRSQQHRGRLMLARAYSKNPNWLRRAEETLQQLTREDPTNADAHYELGLVYKTGGFPARAHTMFRRALELRPGHKEASAELGILPESPPSAGGGLLKRLFKRGKAS